MKDIYSLIDIMFGPYQGKEFRNPKLKDDLYH